MGSKSAKIPAPTDIFAATAVKGKKGKKTMTGPSVAQQQLAGTQQYYGQALPSFLGMQEQYTPQFMEQQFRFGGQALAGMGNLQRQAGIQASDLMSELRSRELGQMTGQVGQVRGLLEAMSPEQAGEVARMQRLAQLGEQEIGAYGQRSQGFLDKYGIGTGATDAASQMGQQMAQEAFARRGTLSPEEQRMAQQSAREASIASGRLGGAGSVASEILNREQAMAARRAEAAQMAGQSSALGRQAAEQRLAGFGQLQDIERTRANLRGMAGESAGQAFTSAGQFYTAPGLSLLGGTPASYQAGLSGAGSALGLGQSMGPQLDYNMPMNLALNRASSLDAVAKAQAEANAKASAARMGMIGSIAGLAAAPFTGGLSSGLGLGSLGSALGKGGFNLGASMFNAGAGAFGAPAKATIV